MNVSRRVSKQERERAIVPRPVSAGSKRLSRNNLNVSVLVFSVRTSEATTPSEGEMANINVYLTPRGGGTTTRARCPTGAWPKVLNVEHKKTPLSSISMRSPKKINK
jgi:hypothetical protein